MRLTQTVFVVRRKKDKKYLFYEQDYYGDIMGWWESPLYATQFREDEAIRIIEHIGSTREHNDVIEIEIIYRSVQ